MSQSNSTLNNDIMELEIDDELKDLINECPCFNNIDDYNKLDDEDDEEYCLFGYIRGIPMIFSNY